MDDRLPFEWGTQVVRCAGGPIPFLQYEPRRRRLPELLDDAARFSGRDYLVQGPRRISYRDFAAGVAAVAGALAGRGVAPGDRVLVLAANSPEWVVSFWAASYLGAVVVAGNGWWSGTEVAHALAVTSPALVVGDARRRDRLPSGTAVMDMDEVRDLVDRAAAGSPPGLVGPAGGGDEHEPALIVFTSGTTGLPKGATLAHRSPIANLHNLLAASGRLPHTLPADRPGAVMLVSGPLFHIGGIQALLLTTVGGGTLVFLEGRFDPVQVLDLIESERVTVWGGVPTMAQRVLEHPSLAGRDVTSLRSVSLGGAPVPPELVGALRRGFPNVDRGVSTVYGMTETGGTVTAASGAIMAEHPGTSGRALAVAEIRIAGPDGTGEGEILARTPGQMLGYWGEANSPIDGEGWVHTGDLGRMQDGLLFVTGRSKDVVIRGGENVAAPHVEAVLLEHPAVAEVAVVGLPHPDLGEEVAAAVVARAGAEIDVEAVAAFASVRLAHFAVPTRWWILDGGLPTNDVGKVDKRSLREAWSDRAS